MQDDTSDKPEPSAEESATTIADFHETRRTYQVRDVRLLTQARLAALSAVLHLKQPEFLDAIADLLETLIPANQALAYDMTLRHRLMTTRSQDVPGAKKPAMLEDLLTYIALYRPLVETRLGELCELAELMRSRVSVDIVVNLAPAPVTLWIARRHQEDGVVLLNADIVEHAREALSVDHALLRVHVLGGSFYAPGVAEVVETWRGWAQRVVGRPLPMDRRQPMTVPDPDGVLALALRDAGQVTTVSLTPAIAQVAFPHLCEAP